MRYSSLVTLLLALVLTAGSAATSAQSADDLFQKALAAERADGNLREAIRLYEQVVKTTSDRALAARALVRMAESHLKLGDADARSIFERVVREFADQPDAAGQARSRLAALPAPPETRGQTAKLVWTGPEAAGAVRGTVSPDGRYLSFLDVPTGALALRDLRDNSTRVLASEPGNTLYYAIFSPDGGRLAYVWWTRRGSDVEFDVRVLPVAGDAPRPRIVYRNPEMLFPRPFGWTPDGRQLLILRSLRDGTNQIAFIRLDDGSARVLKSVPWNYTSLSLSPDGKYVAYDAPTGNSAAPGEIRILAADGSREATAIEGPGVNSTPAWSADGSRLLFISDRTGNPSLWSLPVRDGKPAGSPELVRPDIGRVRLQGVTRNGALYYLSGGVTRSNVWIADMDDAGRASGAPRIISDRFINANSGPAWSPDGHALAYLSARQGGTALVIRSRRTGEERDLTLPREVQTGNLTPAPRWFPDGRSVLAFGFLPEGRGAYFRIDVDSGRVDSLHESRGVSGNGGLGASAISNDGRAIFYLAAATVPFTGRVNLVRLDLDTRQETILTSGVFNAMAMSPDGTRIALQTNDGTPGGCYVEVLPTAGGELRRVTRACAGVGRLAWSSATELIYATGGGATPNQLWRIPATGGEPRSVGVSVPGQLAVPEISPDGRQLTFGVFETGSSEVWALENFLPDRAPRR